MSDRTEKLRALYLVSLLGLAVFAGATAFGGPVAAATINSGDVSIDTSPSVNVTDATIDPSTESEIPVAINVSEEGLTTAEVQLRSTNTDDTILVNSTLLSQADFSSNASKGNVTLPTSPFTNLSGPDTFTLDVTAYNVSDPNNITTISGASDTSTITISDNTAPTISDVNLSESFNNLRMEFNSSEKLGNQASNISVSVAGPNTDDIYTFDGNDFVGGQRIGSKFKYQLGVSQKFNDGDGTYTVSVDTAEDPYGNNDTSGAPTSDYTFTSPFSSKTIENGSGPDVDLTNVGMFTKKVGGGQFVFFRLENASSGFERRDISGEGATTDSELWVNFTVDSFNPDVLMGTANVDSWNYTINQDGSANVNVSLKPASIERNFSAWENGITNPDNWGSEYESSDRSMGAVVDFGIGNLSAGGGGGPSGLDGARLTSDAQAYTVPQLDANQNLSVDVASPHCKANATDPTNECSGGTVNDDGFYEAVIPSSFYQNTWNVSELSSDEVGVTYSSNESASADTVWNITVREDGALVLNGSNIHYSSGTINIVDQSDSGDSGDNNDESTSTTDDSSGGGGGAVATTVTTRSIAGGTTATIERVTTADPTVSIAVEGAEAGVLSVRGASVTFGKATNAENTMTVTASDTQPSNTPSLPVEDRILGYVTVDVSGPLAGDITEGTFTLDLDGSDVDPDDVTAHRYDGSEWEPVTVEPQGDGSVKVTSKDGFSPFAIGANEASDTETPTETGESDTSGTPTDVDTPTPTPLPDDDTSETVEAGTPETDATETDTATPGSSGPGFGFAIAVLALALTVALARRP